jgi:hypothetical protein
MLSTVFACLITTCSPQPEPGTQLWPHLAPELTLAAPEWAFVAEVDATPTGIPPEMIDAGLAELDDLRASPWAADDARKPSPYRSEEFFDSFDVEGLR